MTQRRSRVSTQPRMESTLGKKAARAMNRTLIDMDSYIEKQEGMSIAQMFEEKGEAYFRALELETAKELNVYPILYVGLTSGLRQGELISLPWAAFDMSAKRLRLQKRWINLSDPAVQVLTEEHRRHPQSPHMFLDSKTNQLYTPHRLYYLHRRILKQAHLPAISFRDLQTSAKEMRL